MSENEEDSFSREIKDKEARKLKALSGDRESPWLGLGMFGMVGWSVVVPSVLGVMLGLYLDHHYQAKISWTLSLFFAGLTIGCVMAWYWVVKEETDIHK